MAKQTIGEFLATQRKAKGFTQQYVADLLGVSNKTLSAWETNKAYPDILVLPALAELYGVTADEILNGERRVKEQTAEENFSEKSRDKLYKSKLARNSAKNVILICVGILAAVMVLIGWCLFPVSGADEIFWAALILVILGILTTIIVLFLVIAFSRTLISGSTDFDEEITLSEKSFLLSANEQSIRTVICIGCVWLCGGILALIAWTVATASGLAAGVSVVFYGIFPLAGAVIVLIAALCKLRVVKKYGNTEQNSAVKYNTKLSTLCSIAVLPFIACLIFVIVDSGVQFNRRHFKGNFEELKVYMQTLVLPEYSYEVKLTVPEDLGEEGQSVAEGVSAYINKYDNLVITYAVSYKNDIIKGVQTAKPIKIENSDKTVYNVRYGYHSTVDVRYENGSYSVYKEEFIYVQESTFIYLFYASFAFIAVGITVYACKHKKLKIK